MRLDKTVEVHHCDTIVRVTVDLNYMCINVLKDWVLHRRPQHGQMILLDKVCLCHSGIQNDFNDEVWMVCGRLSCTFHCEKQEVPHVRS